MSHISTVACSDSCQHIRGTLDRMGDKWSLLVISELRGGPRRFGDLRRTLDGISQKMLTLTLRRLERDGLLERRTLAMTMPGVEYELTTLGRAMIEPIRALTEWVRRNGEQIQQAQERFDSGDGVVSDRSRDVAAANVQLSPKRSRIEMPESPQTWADLATFMQNVRPAE